MEQWAWNTYLLTVIYNPKNTTKPKKIYIKTKQKEKIKKYKKKTKKTITLKWT